MAKSLNTLAALATAAAALPLSAILCLLTFAGNLFGAAAARRRPRPDSPQCVPNCSSATILVLNWNGKGLLAHCLPRIIEAVRRDGAGHELLMVDNGSDDGSVEFVRRSFPDVRVIPLPENIGFGPGNNIGVKEARRDIVVLVNSDMFVHRDFLRPLLEPFRNDSRLFTTSSRIFQRAPDGARGETGLTRSWMSRGRVHFHHDPMRGSGGRTRQIAYAGGGCSAYDRSKFLELGGFDPLFRPCYVEDADISFRAWRRGWRALFVPASRTLHLYRRSANRRFGVGGADRFIRTNTHLFLWKTLDSYAELACHFALLPGNLFKAVRAGGLMEVKALLRALGRFPSVLRMRWKERGPGLLSSREVFQVASSPFAFRDRFGEAKYVASADPLRIVLLSAYVPYPPVHGGAVRVFNVLKALSEKNRVHLVSFVERPEEFEYEAELKKVCADVTLVLRRPDCRRTLFMPDMTSEFRSPEMRRAVEEALGREDPDVIQCEWLEMAQYVPQSRRAVTALCEVQVTFVSLRRMWENAPRGKRLRTLRDYAAMLDYELRTCAKFDTVLAMSEKEAALLRAYRPELNAGVFENGVDAAAFGPGDCAPCGNGANVLFVGHFRHDPNREGILYFCDKIWPLVRAQAPQAQLLIAGPEPPAEVRELAAHPGVEVLGFVSDLAPLFRSAAVSIAPILTGSGTRVKILEALLHGVPVVSTSVGAEGLEVSSGTHLCIADAPEEFAKQTAALVLDPARRQALGAAGAALARERYDWRHIAARVESVYRELLDRKNRRT